MKTKVEGNDLSELKNELKTVIAVIVAYHPNLDQLVQICKLLTAEDAQVIIVDNTEVPSLMQEDLPNSCNLLTLGKNMGIASAQNLGVVNALNAGADVVVFFDQDSTLPSGMLKILVHPLSSKTPEIVAPICVDDITGVEIPAIRMTPHGKTSTIYSEGRIEPYEVDIVIASGMAVNRQVFGIVGLLDDDLFIDFVDTDWSLRCRARNISIRIVPRAKMNHRIGDAPKSLGPWTVMVHSPDRCYYQMRNCFHLFRKTNIPFYFAFRETISVYMSRIMLLFFVSPRLVYIKAYADAILDGMRGSSGARPR